jgi:CheY-like chemotaxis protein
MFINPEYRLRGKEVIFMATKILIVDDDFNDLQSMKAVLDKAKYLVFTATNGAQAMDLVNENKFDLILMDIQMPTLSGYDLLRLLRERINHNSKMAYVTIVPKKNVDLRNIDGFIQKPFNNPDFLKTVKEILKGD